MVALSTIDQLNPIDQLYPLTWSMRRRTVTTRFGNRNSAPLNALIAPCELDPASIAEHERWMGQQP